MYEHHPSIISIKENVNVECRFSFTEVNSCDIGNHAFKNKRSRNFHEHSYKAIKRNVSSVCETLTEIWDTGIIQNKNVSSKLKLADISPIHKELETILTKNYRPVSLLPVVSKVFERIMQKRTNKHLSPYLYGYRKGNNCQ